MSDKELTNQGEYGALDPEVIELFDQYFSGPDAEYWIEQYDGLNRDGILKHMADALNPQAATTPEQEEKTRSTIEYFETLLGRQPPFRLERTGDGSIQLVLTLDKRVVHTFTPAKPAVVDNELIELLDQSLKNLVAQSVGRDTTNSADDLIEVVKSEYQALTGPSDVSILERLRRVGGKLMPRRTALKALKDRIGGGKSRDDLLEKVLPDVPKDAQETLAAKMNDQPPFRIQCDEDGDVHVVLITSGQRVHSWSPNDLGVPTSKWRIIYYGAAAVLALLFPPFEGLRILGIVLTLAMAAFLDGFLYLKRTRGYKAAWRAYWAAALLLLVIGANSESNPVLVLGASMIGTRFGYLWLYVKLFAGRDVLECPNCGVLITRREFIDRAYSSKTLRNNYLCFGCGTIAKPEWTGRRVGFFFGDLK